MRAYTQRGVELAKQATRSAYAAAIVTKLENQESIERFNALMERAREMVREMGGK